MPSTMLLGSNMRLDMMPPLGVAGPPVGSFLLLETGDYLLLEDNSRIVLE